MIISRVKCGMNYGRISSGMLGILQGIHEEWIFLGIYEKKKISEEDAQI